MPSPKGQIGEGDYAPEFTLPSHQGGSVSLAAFRGKQRVVLYFYPKDSTPGCTQEACDFRDLHPRILKSGAAVLGVSLDPIPSHTKFSSKFSLPFALLSDPDAAVSKQYGVYRQKSLYGRTFWGIERSTFLIDREGKIEKSFRKVKVGAHAREVLSLLEGSAEAPSPARKSRPKKV